MINNQTLPTKISEILNEVSDELGISKDIISDASSFYFKDLLKSEINNSEEHLEIVLEGLGSFEFYKRLRTKQDKTLRVSKTLNTLQVTIKEYEDLINSKTLEKKQDQRARATLYALQNRYIATIKRLRNYASLSNKFDEYQFKVKKFKNEKN